MEFDYSAEELLALKIDAETEAWLEQTAPWFVQLRKKRAAKKV